MKSEFRGDILTARALEDCIRSTRKYTKGAFHRSPKPSMHIQGGNFPSKVLTEYYEVYPDLEISWDMPASKAIDWVWGDVTHINVRFQYDYRENNAKVIVYGGQEAIKEISIGIPGFSDALSNMKSEKECEQQNRYAKCDNSSGEQQTVPVVDRNNRVRASSISRSQ